MSTTQNRILKADITKNVEMFSLLFKDVDGFITRSFSAVGAQFCLLYSEGMTDARTLSVSVIEPILKYDFSRESDVIAALSDRVISASGVRICDNVDELVRSILYGDCVVLANGWTMAAVIEAKGWATRSISEPEGERALKGPREGFTESISVNLTMLRRKILSPDLKMKYLYFGRRTDTKACVCYVDKLVDRRVLRELMTRLSKIDIDGVLDSNYVSEIIMDAPWTPVKTINSTERPDIVAAKLLEGRIAILVDGTPVVLTVPHLFVEHFQSDDDYYTNYFFSSFNRIIRYIAFFISTSLPAIYLSLITFHQEMLPTPLIMSIAHSRDGVPFPSIIEIIIMPVISEMLRESGARMPGIMGQTLSIVGALVIGEAAVSAKIVSAPIIIIVALTGICGLMLPRLKSFVIILRFALLFSAYLLGLYGYLFGIVFIAIHLFSTDSFGIPIVLSAIDGTFYEHQDSIVRAPWQSLLLRPKQLTRNIKRQTGRDGL